MGHEESDALAIRARFGQTFDLIAEKMKLAAEAEDHRIASLEAERHGLIETVPTKPIGTAWQKTERGITLFLQWRYYDQSRPFSMHKDMNILSLELREDGAILRQAEERYED